MSGTHGNGTAVVDLAIVFGALAHQPRWVAWRHENGTKTPYSPITGKHASTRRHSDWGTLTQARAFAISAGMDGVGIVLGWGLGGFDLDACRNPETGQLTQLALEMVNGFGSYAEISPSGVGIRGLSLGAPDTLPSTRIPVEGEPIGGKRPGCEVYVEGRYLTVTGDLLPGSPAEIRHCGAAWTQMVGLLGHFGDNAAPATTGTGLPSDINALLGSLSADCPHDEWLKVGMALHHADPTQGEALWDSWSASAPHRYPGAAEIRRRWASFSGGRARAVTIGTLRHLATERGYRSPQTNRKGVPIPAEIAPLVASLNAQFATLRPTTTDVPTFITLAEAQANPDLLKEPEPVAPFAFRGRLTAFCAADKSGKSTLFRHEGAAVTRGRPFLGLSGMAGRPGRVVSLGLEEALADAVRGYTDLKADPDRVQLLTIGGRDLFQRTEDLLASWSADLLIVDSLAEYARVIRGEAPADGDNAGWDTVVRPLVSMARRFNVAVVLLHHVRKSDGVYRGPTAIAAAVDAIYEMRLPGDDEEDSAVRHITGRGRWTVKPVSIALRDTGYELAATEKLVLHDRVLCYVQDNPGSSQKKVRDALRASPNDVADAIKRLLERGQLTDRGQRTPTGQSLGMSLFAVAAR